VKTGSAETPQRGLRQLAAPEECAALPSLVSRRKPRAGLVASRQTSVRRRHFRLPDEGGTLGYRRLEISLTASLLAGFAPCCCFAPNPCSSLPSFGRALNPVAPHDDKRVIAMTNEGRPGPPHCGVSGRRLAARAYARRAPPDEMPERILTCFWCCRDWRFLVARSGPPTGRGCARRHHCGHSRLRSGQQIQIDPPVTAGWRHTCDGCCDDCAGRLRPAFF
jgi:hypothetical protein